jgi:hypothetical protein
MESPRRQPRAAIQTSEVPNVAQSVTFLGWTVEGPLDKTLWQLHAGQIGLQDLTPALRGWYTLAYDDGRASLQTALDRANADADRYYLEMCRRPAVPIIDANRPTFAHLQKIRSEIYGGVK